MPATKDYKAIPSSAEELQSTENVIIKNGTDASLQKQPRACRRRRVWLIKIALLLTFVLLWLSFKFAEAGNVGERFGDASGTTKAPKGKKNIIMMVTDGTGPASINMARTFRQHRDNLPYDETLFLDKYFIGSSRTRSNSSYITDSAAGATVFSCGMKSYNGAIGVDPLKNPRGTILEALKLKGYKTGLVVTTSITDATPAAFNSHVDYRFMQTLIANQQLGFNTTLGRVTDLMIGGGRCFYLPGSSKGGCRDDEVNLIDEAEKMGFNVALDKKQFDSWDLGKNVTLPMLSLLAYYNIPFDLDRQEKKYPSLEEEVITALTALSEATKDSDEGFFLLVEGSRIDHAGHYNDPAAQVREVLAYDKAFKAVIDFADSTDVPTYIVSTSDHETGGLDVGRQITEAYPEYLWKPKVLENATHSGEFLTIEVHQFLSKLESESLSEAEKSDKLTIFVEKQVLEEGLGIYDYDKQDVSNLIALKDTSLIQNYLNNMVSVRAQVGWSTHGHTAVDVNIYGHANTKDGRQFLYDHLLGNRENVEVGTFWQKLTGADVDKVTKLLVGTPHKPALLELQAEANAKQIEHGFIYHPFDDTRLFGVDM